MIVGVFFLSKYFDSNKSQYSSGRPLANYDFYPVVTNSKGGIELDRDSVNKAIVELTSNDDVDSRAAGELIRLIENNSASFIIDSENNNRVKSLKKAVYNPNRDNHGLLITLKEIVHGVGQTLRGTPIEIVLHDTRNPLKSVIAIENPVTGRKLYDKNTNFGVELIKKYAKNEIKNGNIVSYPITLDDGRVIKATTIPIYDSSELIAFICINIDTSRISLQDPYELQKTIDNLIKVSPMSEYLDIQELIKPIDEVNQYMASDRIRYSLEKPLLVIREKKGFLACAYINPETCDKTGEACAIVSGVNDYEDMMSAKVVSVSIAAKKLGINVGDLGSSALDKLK